MDKLEPGLLWCDVRLGFIKIIWMQLRQVAGDSAVHAPDLLDTFTCLAVVGHLVLFKEHSEFRARQVSEFVLMSKLFQQSVNHSHQNKLSLLYLWKK